MCAYTCIHIIYYIYEQFILIYILSQLFCTYMFGIPQSYKLYNYMYYIIVYTTVTVYTTINEYCSHSCELVVVFSVNLLKLLVRFPNRIKLNTSTLINIIRSVSFFSRDKRRETLPTP
jgi:hypothetical protein